MTTNDTTLHTAIAPHRIAAARATLAAHAEDNGSPLDEAFTDLIADLGHLAVAEQLDYLGILKRAIAHWSAESDDPEALGPPVTVDITIAPPPPRWTVCFTDIRHVIALGIEAQTPAGAIAKARTLWLHTPDHDSFVVDGGDAFTEPHAVREDDAAPNTTLHQKETAHE